MRHAAAALLLAAACGRGQHGADGPEAPAPGSDATIARERAPVALDAAAGPDRAEQAHDAGIVGTPDAVAERAPDGARSEAPAPAGCAARPVAVCDGFEQPTIDDRLWKTTGATNLKIDDTRSHRGKRSLFVRGVNRRDGGGKIVLEGAAVAPFRDGFFGRAWIYAAERTPRVHSDLVFASGPANGGTVVWRYGIEGHVFAGNWWGAGGEGAFPPDRLFTKRDAVPVDRWFCMEWQLDSKSNEMRLWLDGAERRSLWRLGGTWPAPPFQRIELGFQMFGQDTGGDFLLWFDDVALDRQRIGCE